jgi:N-carbamoylputrescine amidase
MALRGADILIYPTAIGWDSGEPEAIYTDQLLSWTISMQGHAVANSIFVIAVNRIGDEGHIRFWGHSFLSGPDGKIRVQNGVEEGLFKTSLDMDEMESQRRVWPFFRDRRIDQYGDLLKQWVDQ